MIVEADDGGFLTGLHEAAGPRPTRTFALAIAADPRRRKINNEEQLNSTSPAPS